jgi:hypothetical protein
MKTQNEKEKEKVIFIMYAIHNKNLNLLAVTANKLKE